jgi:hypothetical protein
MHKSKRLNLSPSPFEKLWHAGADYPESYILPSRQVTKTTIRHEVVTRIDDLMNNYIRRHLRPGTTTEGYDVHFVR